MDTAPGALPEFVVTNIVRKMLDLRLSQIDLGLRSGIAQPTISRILDRKRGTTTVVLEKIAKALGCELVDLFLPAPSDDDYEALLTEFRDAQERLSIAAQRLARWAERNRTV